MRSCRAHDDGPGTRSLRSWRSPTRRRAATSRRSRCAIAAGGWIACARRDGGRTLCTAVSRRSRGATGCRCRCAGTCTWCRDVPDAAAPMSAVAPSRPLVHLASGIGNIMLATPLLVALSRRFESIDLRLDCDYPGAGELFRHWSALREVFDTRAGQTPGGAYDIVVPAIPPFAWPRFAGFYRDRAEV